VPSLSLESPVGPLTIIEDAGALTAIIWGGKAAGEPTRLLTEAKRQLSAYFAGKRQSFDLPLAPDGSILEHRVWALMVTIPYGQTRSYGALARDLDLSPREIGFACARNKLPILLPCHRVIAADGGLTGYSGEGGIETKRKLLQLEGALLI
jgi:methylated-DNA-[protein]-cysteine S-methyltransferase